MKNQMTMALVTTMFFATTASAALTCTGTVDYRDSMDQVSKGPATLTLDGEKVQYVSPNGTEKFDSVRTKKTDANGAVHYSYRSELQHGGDLKGLTVVVSAAQDIATVQFQSFYSGASAGELQCTGGTK